MQKTTTGPQIRAVLFDYGMVLSGPPRKTAWEEMRTLLHLSEEKFHELYWKYRDDYDRGTLSGTEYWHRIAHDSAFQLQDGVLAELKHFDVETWTDTNTSMIDWAIRLQRAGIHTGILSNIGDAMEEGIRAKFSWIEDFTHHVWSHQLKMRKPEPAIYAAAAQGLGVSPEEILFIDDREENIHAAQKAGMQAILYSTHDNFEKQIEQKGLGGLLRLS